MAAPQTRMLSCASLTDFPNDIGAIRDLATMQWIRPVRFREAIEHLHANEGVSTFIEVGPSSHLTSFIEDTLRKRDFLAVATNDRRRSGLDQFLRSIGQLWTRGMSVDFTAMFRHRAISAVDPFATKPPEKAANRHRIVLNLQMPEMTLSDPIVAELRELTTRGRKSPTPQSANAEVSIPATPLQGIQTSAVQPGEVGASPTKEASREAYTPVAADLLFAHENLMREFLASQERTIDAVVASQLASQSREP